VILVIESFAIRANLQAPPVDPDPLPSSLLSEDDECLLDASTCTSKLLQIRGLATTAASSTSRAALASSPGEAIGSENSDEMPANLREMLDEVEGQPPLFDVAQEAVAEGIDIPVNLSDMVVTDAGGGYWSRRRGRHHTRHHYRGSGRRRTPATLFKSTPVYEGPLQPPICNGTRLKKGRQGCCAGQPFDLDTLGCCGSVLYETAIFSCCSHADNTATIFDPYTTNCCDDEFKTNKESGICELHAGETSCCTLGRNHRRRRRSHISQRIHQHTPVNTTISRDGMPGINSTAVPSPLPSSSNVSEVPVTASESPHPVAVPSDDTNATADPML